jgi:hypothetical protein
MDSRVLLLSPTAIALHAKRLPKSTGAPSLAAKLTDRRSAMQPFPRVRSQSVRQSTAALTY